ncbi:MAG: hypothetical protein PWQ10_98 [Patescibacteria group bacterium]|nr:hypothetical protein [Patescibacteria group bacterium]
MNSKKKRIVIICSIAIILLIVLTIFIVYRIQEANNVKNQDSSNVVDMKANADESKSKAMEAISNGNAEEGKGLLEEARDDYKKLNDTDNVIDTEAQLYSIDHPVAPAQD